MIDPKELRQSAPNVAENLARRGMVFDADEFISLDAQRKTLQVETDKLRAERNASAKRIGIAKSKGQDVKPLIEAVESLGTELQAKESRLQAVLEDLRTIELGLPNLIHADVPNGQDESDNAEMSTWGDLPTFDFEVRDHVDVGTDLGMLDFDAASRISGARFTVLKGPLARLQRALIQFMLDLHVSEHGYEETYVPYLVLEEALIGTGQLPKFGDDLFRTAGADPYFLIPTAEVPVTNLGCKQIFDAEELPKRYVAHTPCFRSEAGSYGRDTRGMIRQHQFEKVELVHFTRPEDSGDALEALTRHAEVVLERLALPYRKVLLCAGDIGFGAHKTYDLEVWLPGQSAYREISSCSNYRDFQARRMQARWRNPADGKPELLHTLNGSGVAAGRALVAILENYQQANGSVRVPEVLKPYMGGITQLQPQG